jgi:hypothetical protein
MIPALEFELAKQVIGKPLIEHIHVPEIDHVFNLFISIHYYIDV